MMLRTLPNRHAGLRRLVTTYAVLLLLIVSFLGGFLTGVRSSTARGHSLLADTVTFLRGASGDDVDPQLFASVWDEIQRKYVHRPIDTKQLFYGSVSGLVASLGDPYSVFLNPEMTQVFSEEISGSFEGIGAEIGMKDDQLVIIAPLAGSPAERAGVKANDAILRIDGEDTRDLTIDVAVQRIRGQDGTDVTLTLFREGSEPEDVVIRRERITTESVTTRTLDGNIGYIQITNFREDTDQDFTKAVSALLVTPPAGLILDLRNNPGGFLEPAIDVASHFVDDSQIVVIEATNDDQRQEYRGTRRSATLADVPVVVLINGGSASASEIVAGALQDHERATLVGETTFGKGTVQDYETFDDGSSLKLTVARWLTSNGRTIDKDGITPDDEVALTSEDIAAGRDPQLERARAIILGTP